MINQIIVSQQVPKSIADSEKDTNSYIFKTLADLELFVNETPIRVDSIFLFDDVVRFTNSDLTYAKKILESKFLLLEGGTYYITKDKMRREQIKEVIERIDDTWQILFSNMSVSWLTDFFKGKKFKTSHERIETHVFRVSTKEYRERKEAIEREIDTSTEYVLKEEGLDGLDDQDFEDIGHTVYEPISNDAKVINVVVHNRFLEACFLVELCEYLSKEGKTLIIDRDYDYHTLLEVIKRYDIKAGIVYIEDLYMSFDNLRNQIYTSDFIVVASRTRESFDYNTLYDLLYYNFGGYLKYIVKTYEPNTFLETERLLFLTASDIPTIARDLLEPLSKRMDSESIKYLALDATFGSYSITKEELEAVLKGILGLEKVRADKIFLNGFEIGSKSALDLDALLG